MLKKDVLHVNAKRLPHLDLMRLLAIYLVIFNHTGNRGYMLFSDVSDSPISFLYLAFSIFCKIAVPLFFMISGALLLKKEESLKQLFSKRIARMAVILLFISIPYYYWLHRANGMRIGDFLKYIYSNSATTSLWYLYSYIALLLMLPFLRSMVKNLSSKDYLYLFVGYITLVGVVPCLEYLLWGGEIAIYVNFSPVLFVTQNVFFALMGNYFENVLDVRHYNKKNVGWGIVLSIIAIIVSILMTYYQMKEEATFDTNQLEKFFNCFIGVPTVTVYFLMKYVNFEKIKNETTCNVISSLGSAVFGVYLIEKFVRALLSSVYDLCFPLVGSFISSLIWCLAVLCFGMGVVLLLKNIPGIKRIVNMFI